MTSRITLTTLIFVREALRMRVSMRPPRLGRGPSFENVTQSAEERFTSGGSRFRVCQQPHMSKMTCLHLRRTGTNRSCVVTRNLAQVMVRVAYIDRQYRTLAAGACDGPGLYRNGGTPEHFHNDVQGERRYQTQIHRPWCGAQCLWFKLLTCLMRRSSAPASPAGAPREFRVAVLHGTTAVWRNSLAQKFQWGCSCNHMPGSLS